MTIKLTREEAIQDLEAIKSFERYARGRLALDVAIEALKQVTGKLNNHDDSLLTADSEACKEQKSKLDLISRAEAIEAIEIVDWYHQNQNKDMVSGANDDEHQAWYKAEDVYKALEAIPSANRPKDGDLISRTDAIEALGEEPLVWCDEDYEIAERSQWRADIEAIKSVPSADRPRPIDTTCAVDLESGVVPRSACEPRGAKTIVYENNERSKHKNEKTSKTGCSNRSGTEARETRRKLPGIADTALHDEKDREGCKQGADVYVGGIQRTTGAKYKSGRKMDRGQRGRNRRDH